MLQNILTFAMDEEAEAEANQSIKRFTPSLRCSALLWGALAGVREVKEKN